MIILCCTGRMIMAMQEHYVADDFRSVFRTGGGIVERIIPVGCAIVIATGLMDRNMANNDNGYRFIRDRIHPGLKIIIFSSRSAGCGHRLIRDSIYVI